MSNKAKAPQAMLACAIENVADIEAMLPLIASPKLDGVRAMVIDNIVYSRNMKPIPNDHVQKKFGRAEFNGLDGELIVGDPVSPSVYRDTVSGVMREDGIPNVTFYVFDRFDRGDQPYSEALDELLGRVEEFRDSGAQVAVLSFSQVKSMSQFTNAEETWVNAGYEGIMLRKPSGKYKFGRATLKSQELMKFKRFADAEAEIYDVDELFSNQNAATINVLGLQERSSHKENMVPMNTLGALKVIGIGEYQGVDFSIGSGFDEATRKQLWAEHAAGKLAGKIVKYKYFPVGNYDKPRFPIFIGFRDKRDM